MSEFISPDLPNYLIEKDRDKPTPLAPVPLPDGVTYADIEGEFPEQQELESHITTMLYDMNIALEEEGSIRDTILGDAEEDSAAGIIDPPIWKSWPSERLLDIHHEALDKATQLRSEGQHHQAYAYEYVAAVGEFLYDTVGGAQHYDKSVDPQHWAQSHHLDAALLDSDDPSSVVGFSASESLHYQTTCTIECERSAWMDSINTDAKTLTRGAVVRDILPLTGNDVESAKVMAALLSRS